MCVRGKKAWRIAGCLKRSGARKTPFRGGLALRVETDSQDDSGLFTACFGKPRIFAWHPLSNAVYWEETRHSDVDYILDECRVYHCRGGAWQEERYNSLYFNRNKFHGLLRETDRLLRRFLKTGHYLRKKAEEAWAAPYAETVIEAERRAEEEAARPKITINLSSLEHIRQDALVTRDRLLTENEMEIEPAAAVRPGHAGNRGDPDASAGWHGTVNGRLGDGYGGYTALGRLGDGLGRYTHRGQRPYGCC